MKSHIFKAMNTKNTFQLETLLDAHGDALYNYARLKTNDANVAADLVQDTFEAAIAGFAKFKGESKGRTWLFGILKHKILDYYKTKSRTQSFSGNEEEDLDIYFDDAGGWRAGMVPIEPPAALLDQPDFLKILYDCLNKLPALWKSVLVSKYLEAKETKRLCQELNLSTTNYWQVNHRAKLTMQQCLQSNWFQ